MGVWCRHFVVLLPIVWIHGNSNLHLHLHTCAQGFGGWLRNVLVSVFDIGVCTTLALVFHSKSSTTLAITGAAMVDRDLLMAFAFAVVVGYQKMMNEICCSWQFRHAGATGVLLISFVIPIINHFILLTNR